MTATLDTDTPHRTDIELTETDLAAVVRRLAADPAVWEPLIDHAAPQRQWAAVSVPEGIDVWVISWRTSHATELHGHGDATAAFTVVRGEITELRPDPQGRLAARTFTAGEVQLVRPGEVHDVRNDHAEPAVTIHAYSPRLTEMVFYRAEAGRLAVDRVVRADSEEAAAW